MIWGLLKSVHRQGGLTREIGLYTQLLVINKFNNTQRGI